MKIPQLKQESAFTKWEEPSSYWFLVNSIRDLQWSRGVATWSSYNTWRSICHNHSAGGSPDTQRQDQHPCYCWWHWCVHPADTFLLWTATDMQPCYQWWLQDQIGNVWTSKWPQKEEEEKKTEIIRDILPVLSGCDPVSGLWSIGKGTVLSVLNSGRKSLSTLGNVTACTEHKASVHFFHCTLLCTSPGKESDITSLCYLV